MRGRRIATDKELNNNGMSNKKPLVAVGTNPIVISFPHDLHVARPMSLSEQYL